MSEDASKSKAPSSQGTQESSLQGWAASARLALSLPLLFVHSLIRSFIDSLIDSLIDSFFHPLLLLYQALGLVMARAGPTYSRFPQC